MSYDLWVNSLQEQVIRKELLKDKMLSDGWEIRFLTHDAFTGEKGVALLPSDGPVDENLLLAGWRTEQKNSNLMAQLFSQGEAKQLEKLCRDEDAICACSLSASKSDEENVETTYYFRLHGAGIVSSWDFTHVAWEAIGALSDGELVNPQEGIGEESPFFQYFE